MAWGFGSFGAPSPSTVANNAGMGPFGSVNWSGRSTSSSGGSGSGSSSSSSSSRTPSAKEVAESKVGGGRRASNTGAKASDVASANEPATETSEAADAVSNNSQVEFSDWSKPSEGPTSDFSWVTAGGWGKDESDKSWAEKNAEKASDIKALNTMTEVRDRNWYSNDQINDLNKARTLLGEDPATGTMFSKGIEQKDINKKLEDIVGPSNETRVAAIRDAIRGAAENNELASIENANQFRIGDKTAVYPNDMSKEEFDAMYEYALGMSGKGENTENGVWGSFETLPLKIQALTEELERAEKVGSETRANAAREQLNNAKEQLNALESFISNYKDLYSPTKKKSKSDYERDMNEASESVLKTYADLFAATDQIETIQNGYDHRNNKFTPGQNEYTDKYGNEFTTDISVYGDKVTIVTSVYSADGQFGKSIIETTNDYKGLESALTKATENEKNVDKEYQTLVNKYNDAKASFEGAEGLTKQDIMDAYAAGKMNAYQAAVALTKADDDTISFAYDDIISDIDYNKFSGPVAGDRGDSTVGVDSFMSDITGPDIMAGEKEPSPTDMSKKITADFVALNDMKDRLNEIDVTDIKSKEQAEGLSNDLSGFLNDLSIKANNELQTLVTSLMETGKSLQDVRNDPNFKNLSTELFTLAQAVYDKTSAVEEYTGRYFGDIDISSRRAIKKNIREVSDKIAEMQGAKRIVHTDDKGRMSIVLNREEVNALANYGKTIDATKDAAIALMKSAAFNGAENVEGDFYSTAWKKANAETMNDDEISKAELKDSLQDIAAGFFGTKDSGKLTIGDYIAACTKGMIGIVATGLGAATMAVNPVLGTMLVFAGVNTIGREGLKVGTSVARSNSTNEETMFGTKNDKGRQVWNEIYNRSFEKANFGDAKSVSTWTAAVNILGGLVETMSGGIGFVDGINRIKQNVEILATGGLERNTDRTITNVYALGKNIVEWSEMNPEVMSGMSNPKDRNTNTEVKVPISTGGNYSNKDGSAVKGGYGVAKGGANLASTYSGYREQAKDSNLAKDYNAGMEQEVNEAVSDERVKGYIVKIYGNEPDYIRKAISKILSAHSEREW